MTKVDIFADTVKGRNKLRIESNKTKISMNFCYIDYDKMIGSFIKCFVDNRNKPHPDLLHDYFIEIDDEIICIGYHRGKRIYLPFQEYREQFLDALDELRVR